MLNWGVGFWEVYGDENKPPIQKTKFPIQCPNCGTHTDAEIKDIFVTTQNKWVKLPADMSIHNYFLRCTRCSTAILVMWSYSEDIHRAGQTVGAKRWPYPTSAFLTESTLGEAVPPAIFEDLRQAEMAQDVGAHYGAALLLRRACQYICRHQKVSEVNTKGRSIGLKAQIAELAEKGVITKHLVELAENIRIIGNEIAHPDAKNPSKISPKDVSAAQEFLHQITRAIYVDPHKAAEVRKRLKKKKVKEA